MGEIIDPSISVLKGIRARCEEGRYDWRDQRTQIGRKAGGGFKVKWIEGRRG